MRRCKRVTEERALRGIVLGCGTNLPLAPTIDQAHLVRVPERPGKADLDETLREAAALEPGEGADLVVVGTDADLAAVVLRLLRTDRLAALSVGFVPARKDSVVGALWNLPAVPERAFGLATRGEVDRVPLIRDDKGGVLMGRATFGTVRGEAYCDDTRAFRGIARRIEVTPDNQGGDGVAARVTTGTLLRRTASYTGRAFQLGCEPATPVIDGVPQPREAKRWTFYRHTEDLRLVRGIL